MVSPGGKVRPYNQGDEAAIRELFQRVFGYERSLEEWGWKFRDNPWSQPGFIRLAEHEGRIVGQYAVLSTRFQCLGKEGLAVQPVDNMIDPEYRQGLGKAKMQKALFRAVLDHCGEAGAIIGYGFPNQEAYRLGSKLLGYQDLGPIEQRFRPLTWARHARRLLGRGRVSRALAGMHAGMHKLRLSSNVPGLPGARVRHTPTVDKGFDRLWAEARSSYGILAVRDSQYLQWRYCHKPGADYTFLLLEQGDKLLGYTVLAVEGEAVRVGRVVDIFSLPDDRFLDKLLSSSLGYFLDQQADRAECWCLAGARYEQVIRKYFPCRHPEHIRAVFRILDKSLDPQRLADRSNWLITMGDADSV